MKNVFIKYNPFKIVTEIMVNNQPLPGNSVIQDYINPVSPCRLQEWIDELPIILKEEYNENNFDITFCGTQEDFEDVEEIFDDARTRYGIETSLHLKKAKDVKDKEKLIEGVFAKIQQGPFPELRDQKLINAFNQAKSAEFEVCVVATMSAGKSTLINSLLANKLMPSKQEACTAIITRIKDNDNADWRAKVYDNRGKEIQDIDNLTYEVMDALNSDPEVAEIHMEGNIPFVDSDEVSLVLIDTPGPNNARNKEHQAIQRNFLNKSSKSLVLYVLEGTFGNTDDDTLLNYVADSMSIGGKQSRDRFIFVVNKMDDRRKEDGDTVSSLDRVRGYLKDHGIDNPNLFPIAALPALNIRLLEHDENSVDEDLIDETGMKVKKFNRNADTLHLEKYAVLPLSLKEKLENLALHYKDNRDANNEALIHTGVPSVEAAISQYVNKYAKTAKIKNIVDTFNKKLEEVNVLETLKKEILDNEEVAAQIGKQIEIIQNKINSGKNAQQFKDRIKLKVAEVNKEAEKTVEAKQIVFQGKVKRELDSIRERTRMRLTEADRVTRDIGKFGEKLDRALKTELQVLIDESLQDTCKKLLNEYRLKISSLSDEVGEFNSIQINSLKLMDGSISESLAYIDIDDYVEKEQVKVGEEYVKNTNKKWWKPWTWGEESGYYRNVYETREYVDGSRLAQEFLSPLQEPLFETCDAAKKHTYSETKRIQKRFEAEFDKLDNILMKKLEELKAVDKDKASINKKLEECKKREQWILAIKAEVDTILDI